MVTKVKNKDGEVKCPVCQKNLDGQITYAHVAGQDKPMYVHRKCLGGKSV
jgi:uncharacterized Zn finger protein (UPF0148 family)